MRLAKILGVLAVLGGLVVLALVAVPSISGQTRTTQRRLPPIGQLNRGVEIGVSIRDVDADKEAGVLIAEVAPDGPAAQADMKPSDIVVEFDGERVRSARQFSRLVQETVPGRTVRAMVVRGGQRKELQIKPADARRADRFLDDSLRDSLGNLADRFGSLDFDFDLDASASSWRHQLGVTVQELTPQLAEYFGAKEGLLVSAVTDLSPAARAGLKAGDVVTSLNGERVNSSMDLVRLLVKGSNTAGDVTIGIVRDKKESTLKARIEPKRDRARSGRAAERL